MMSSDSLPGPEDGSIVINKVHPVIRVVLFLVFAGFVSIATGSQLIIGGLLLAVLYGLSGPVHLKPAFAMMRRMRWFFLSILIIYSWLTPGQAIPLPVSSSYQAWLPTIEGIASGMMRALSLTLILMAVNLLLRCTSRQQLITAIYWLTTPLHLFGVSRERLSVRIVLILDLLYEVQGVVTDSFAEVKGTVTSLDRIGDFAAAVFHKITHNAENTPNRTITLHGLSAPQALQWLLPVILWGMFVSADLVRSSLAL